MRTHFLAQLPLGGRDAVLQAFPDFDFYNLSRVTRFIVEWGKHNEALADCCLAALYTDTSISAPIEVTLCFQDVRHASLPDFSPLFFLTELEIEDVSSHQLEGVRFRTKNFGSTAFEVLSGDISIEIAWPKV
jgi:hypothetical protein